MYHVVSSMIRLLALLVAANLAQAGWEEYRTGPFEVWTEGSEKEARQLLVRLEQTRDERWWLAFGPLPVITALWAYEAWRNGGLVALRTFLSAFYPDDHDEKQE